MHILYLDVAAGLNLKMLAGALSDLLYPKIMENIFPDFEMHIEQYQFGSVSGRKVNAGKMREENDISKVLNLSDVISLMDKYNLEQEAKALALRVIHSIAKTSACLIGGDEKDQPIGLLEEICLTILCSAMITELRNDGVQQILCSPVPLGSGLYTEGGGTLPLPKPLTLHLLKNIPVVAEPSNGIETSPLCTALVVQVANGFGQRINMQILKSGYGFCEHEGDMYAMRAIIGEKQYDDDTDQVCLLECNLDDITGESMGYVMQLLLDSGALDVYYTPIQMKKSRPAIMLSVLCKPECIHEMTRIIMRETTTLGVRRTIMDRTVLKRKTLSVKTEFGMIRVKISGERELRKIKPEYEDCAAAARCYCVPLQTVHHQALQAAQIALELDK